MATKRLSEDQAADFEDLCASLCSKEEICASLRMSRGELEKAVDTTYSIPFEEAYARFSAKSKADLRKAQLKLALDGDRSMLVWLGKQHLGQTDPDKASKQKPGEDAGAKRTASFVSFMSNSPVNRSA